MPKNKIPVETMEDLVEYADKLHEGLLTLEPPKEEISRWEEIVSMVEHTYVTVSLWNLSLLMNDHIEVPEGWEPKYE